MERMTSWAKHPDLQAVLAAVEKKEFKALSCGLGLGEAKTAAAKPRSVIRPEVRAFEATSTRPSPSMPTAPAPEPVIPPLPITAVALAPLTPAQFHLGPDTTKRSPAPGQAGIGRLLLAWGIDFIFVVLALTAALGIAFGVHTWRGDQVAWLGGRPMQWLMNLSPAISLAAVYALFLVYALFFRLLVGRTCGETLLGLRPMPRQRRVKR